MRMTLALFKSDISSLILKTEASISNFIHYLNEKIIKERSNRDTKFNFNRIRLNIIL